MFLVAYGTGALSYTKHYFAGTQRVSSKIGTTTNLGKMLQEWTLLENSSGGAPINLVSTSHDQLSIAEAGVTQVYTLFDISPAPTFTSNTAFNAVPTFTGTETETDHYFFHPDHLGSSNYITNFVGEVSQHMEYFAFGETFIEEHKNSHNSPFKYNGKELDEESGLYYYGARYYDPRISIWASVDPLVEQTMQSYIYVSQNPINLVDPTGMSEDEPPSEKRKALLTIDVYKNSESITKVWNKIDQQDFFNDLENIVKNPGSIDQANTNLCGIVSALVILAEKKPLEFVEMAISFYQKGTYGGLNSNTNLYDNSPTNGLNNAEYVIMTSLKNGLNSFGYDPSNDNGLSGMTTPKDVDKLMSTFGFQKVNNGSIKDINNKNFSAILLVNWDGLIGGTQGKKKNGSVVNVPTHYIKPSNFNVMSNGNYDIDFTHWGSSSENIKVTPSVFNRMVHGIAVYK